MNQLEPHYSIEETAKLGDKIYEESIRTQVEAKHQGQVVAIDVKTSNYAIGNNAIEAVKNLNVIDKADIWFVRIGQRTLHRIAKYVVKEK